MTESRVPFTEDQTLDVGAHVCAIHDGPERVAKDPVRSPSGPG